MSDKTIDEEIKECVEDIAVKLDYFLKKYGFDEVFPTLAPEEKSRLKLEEETLEALIGAAETFEFYSREHRLKKTPFGDRKAMRNEEYCQRLIVVIEKLDGRKWEEIRRDRA